MQKVLNELESKQIHRDSYEQNEKLSVSSYSRNIFSKVRTGRKPLNANDDEWSSDEDDEPEEEKYDRQMMNDWHIRKAAERERQRQQDEEIKK